MIKLVSMLILFCLAGIPMAAMGSSHQPSAPGVVFEDGPTDEDCQCGADEDGECLPCSED